MSVMAGPVVSIDGANDGHLRFHVSRQTFGPALVVQPSPGLCFQRMAIPR